MLILFLFFFFLLPFLFPPINSKLESCKVSIMPLKSKSRTATAASRSGQTRAQGDRAPVLTLPLIPSVMLQQSSRPSFPWLNSASSLSNCPHTFNLMLLIVPRGQRMKLRTRLRPGRIRDCTMRFPYVQHQRTKRLRRGDLWLLVPTHMINCKETSSCSATNAFICLFFLAAGAN